MNQWKLGIFPLFITQLTSSRKAVTSPFLPNFVIRIGSYLSVRVDQVFLVRSPSSKNCLELHQIHPLFPPTLFFLPWQAKKESCSSSPWWLPEQMQPQFPSWTPTRGTRRNGLVQRAAFTMALHRSVRRTNWVEKLTAACLLLKTNAFADQISRPRRTRF